jgi:hypothetical protein
MFDEGDANLATRAEEEREGSLGCGAFAGGLLDEDADHLGGAEVALVWFDDDGATGGERGGDIAARDGEREWEIAGAENDDRAERNEE